MTSLHPDAASASAGSPHQHPHRTPSASRRLSQRDTIGAPWCRECGSDEFISIESFTPADSPGEGLGEITYHCTMCGGFSGHAVPANWTLPGWYYG